MFDYLKKFNKIIVTGPGRSGTTIAARIVADELKYKFVDELFFDGGNVKKFNFFLALPRKMIIQMTCLVASIHLLGKRDDLAVIMMKRDTNDILTSMNHTLTFNSYDPKHDEVSPGSFTACTPKWEKSFLKQYGLTEGNIPEVVYDFWNNHQKAEIKHWFELEYESLKNHPLWIEKPERRRCFTHIKQINFNPNYIRDRAGVMVVECLV